MNKAIDKYLSDICFSLWSAPPLARHYCTTRHSAKPNIVFCCRDYRWFSWFVHSCNGISRSLERIAPICGRIHHVMHESPRNYAWFNRWNTMVSSHFEQISFYCMSILCWQIGIHGNRWKIRLSWFEIIFLVASIGIFDSHHWLRNRINVLYSEDKLLQWLRWNWHVRHATEEFVVVVVKIASNMRPNQQRSFLYPQWK